MPSILRNDDAEALILDIRTGRTAASQEIGPDTGAFLTFPTSVVTPGPASGQMVYPLGCDVETGALVTGPGTALVTGKVAGVSVRGTFSWRLGDRPAAPVAYRFWRAGREVPEPPWASQLPASMDLRPGGPTVLARQQSRLRRQAQVAEHWLFTLTERLVRQSLRGPIKRALRYRPPIDEDDVVQRSLQAACRLLPVYASPDRPPCSWLGMLRLDGRRDMHREVTRLDWLPPDAVAALALAQANGIDPHGDASATRRAISDAAERVGRPVPRVGPAQLEAARRAPGLVRQAAAARATIAGPEAGDDDAGRVAAAVARLVSKDQNLIALAGAGDPRALRVVGQQVVRSVSATRTNTTLARDQAWEEFQRSGQLFATPAGRKRFGAVADLPTLTAIDDCLRQVAGIRPTGSAAARPDMATEAPPDLAAVAHPAEAEEADLDLAAGAIPAVAGPALAAG